MLEKRIFIHTSRQCLNCPAAWLRTFRRIKDRRIIIRFSVFSPQSAKKRLTLAILFFCLLAWASPALAHRVLVYAYAEGETIHTESKFVGSGPVQKGEVQVQDKKNGAVLLTGTTNDQGKFSFKIPPEAAAGKMDLLIVVGASMGHQGEWLLKAETYLPGVQTVAPAQPAAGPAPAAVTPGPRIPAGDQQALEEALNKALERQLAPVKEMLTQLTSRRTSLTDIIGGLGYIAGLFGVAAYVMSRKQPKS
jgi:nickel transport protein